MFSQQEKVYLLAVDLDGTMNNELPRLSRATSKQSPEYSRIQPPLHRSVRHVHVRRPRNRPLLDLSIRARSSPRRLLRAIKPGKIGEAHGHDRGKFGPEHALPLLLPDLFAVVGARRRLGLPLLLEEGVLCYPLACRVGEVVEVVFVP